ncbi:hypothetical protein, partial [Methylicorpusculum sp.]|uniref:hypothetical protein n=1 Tax=Methylicorpusculum sp. TaxID=2713644 RepID=UPI002AB85DD0
HWYSTWEKAAPVLDYTLTRVVLPMAGLAAQVHYAHKGAVVQEAQQEFQKEQFEWHKQTQKEQTELQKRLAIAQMTLQMGHTWLDIKNRDAIKWSLSACHYVEDVKSMVRIQDCMAEILTKDVQCIETYINGTAPTLNTHKLLGIGKV